MWRRDVGVTQRQGIGVGVVGDGTVPQHVAGVPPGDQRAAHPDIILLSRAGRRIGSGIRYGFRNSFGNQVMALLIGVEVEVDGHRTRIGRVAGIRAAGHSVMKRRVHIHNLIAA